MLNKFVDAAGIGQYAYSLLRLEERDKIVYIAESRAIPSHCVVVRKNLNKKVVNRLQDILFALNQGPNKKLLKYLYNVDGYIKVTHKDYEEVAKVGKEYGFLKK